MRTLGADSFWYWGVGAFIHAGAGTTESISGRDYRTADHTVGEDELLTIDCSPQRDGIRGDFARTLVVENGVALEDARDTSCGEWRDGIAAEYVLHHDLVDVATPAMTFTELAGTMNTRIAELGYENLDFRGNLGHSIARSMADRVWLESGNTTRLGDVPLFTFEPHIRRAGGTYGYKHENIYRFVGDRLTAL